MYPGQEDGAIVARLLFGLANPSGKTPVTYPVAAADLPAATPEQFPGVKQGSKRIVHYSEELQIGYRWFDAKGIKPLFPFGHGLSYTQFALSGFRLSAARVDSGLIKATVDVRNTGRVAGAEVVQL